MYCIYEIKNLINNKTYIGQHKTNNLNDAYMGSGLLIKKSIEKYGIENFKKNILAITETKENVNILEKVFIKLYREEGKAEYNISDGGTGGDLGKSVNKLRGLKLKGRKAWNKGVPCSEETKKKISEINTGKKHVPCSEETKRKISKSNLGKIVSEETKKKISYKNKGHVVSQDTKLKISKANKGRKLSDEHKRKIGKSIKGRFVGDKNPNYGNHFSFEIRKKISESNKGKHNIKLTNEQKLKISKANKGRKLSDEHKRKLSESSRGRKLSVECKKKLSDMRKGDKNGFYGKVHTDEVRKHLSNVAKEYHWYTNGVDNIRSKNCPEGFRPGRVFGGK